MAKSPGAVIRQLGGLAAALTRLGQSASDVIYRAPSEVIPGIDTSLFPNPGQPVRPMAPSGSEPLAFPFQYATNLTYTPRADAEYSAEDLKRLSEYPLSRWCIENVKDIVTGLQWQIQPRAKFGEAKEALEARAQGDKNIATITKFFERPDGEHDWPEWVRPLLEDMLVIDAPATLVRRDKKGKVGELRVTPGHVITRYIDANGYTPKPPAPAFSQLWSGIPRVNLTSDQLVYKPRNIAPRNSLQSCLYGYGPTEQSAPEIEVGIKRLEWVGLSYTAGAIPGMLQIVPAGVDPKKIEEAQKWMNSRLAGNLAERQQFQMAQGFTQDGKDQFVQTREKLLADAFDDLHIHKICFAYGTSPQRLLKMMNRATANSNQEAAQEEGTKPWATWLFRIYMNHILQVQMGYADYEFGFSMDVESDPVKIATANGLKLGKYISLNEARKGEGKDPRPEPEADEIGMITPTGWMSITQHAPAGGSAAGGPETPGNGNPGEAKPPKPSAGEPPTPKALLVLDGMFKAVDWQFTPRAATVEIQKAIAGLEDVKNNCQRTDGLALLKAIEGLEWLAKYSEDQERVPAGHPGGGEFGGGGGGAGIEFKPSEKMIRAMNSQNHCGVEKQRIAEEQERITARAIGIPRTADNSAFDFRNDDVGVELKTVIDQKNGKITMSNAALGRKIGEARDDKLRTFTVVADKRSGGGGTHYYIKAGLGSFRISSMQRATLAEIREMVH